MSPVRRILFIVTVLGTSAGTFALGRWQLRRLAARKASNAIYAAALARPPLRLADVTDRTAIDSGRRVVATGVFDTADQIVLRGRAQDDQPGLQIATPLRLDSTTVLWVLRGFVPSPDAATPPAVIPAPAPGTVTVGGLAMAVPEIADSGRPLRNHGTTTWQRLDWATLQRRQPGSLRVYLLLTSDASGPGRLPAIPVPVLSNGPHLSYAIQWFGITIAILGFGVFVLWQEGSGRILPHESR